MNERIQELVHEANLEGYLAPNNKVVAKNLEKFAELIVKECVFLVKDYVDHRIPASEYATLMENYFKD